METIATSKGQIVIPASIRRKFGIKEGTRIQVTVNEKAHEIILKPITRSKFIADLGPDNLPYVLLAPLGAAIREAHATSTDRCVVKPVQRAQLHETLTRVVTYCRPG